MFQDSKSQLKYLVFHRKLLFLMAFLLSLIFTNLPLFLTRKSPRNSFATPFQFGMFFDVGEAARINRHFTVLFGQFEN